MAFEMRWFVDTKSLSVNELRKLEREIRDAIQTRYEQEKDTLKNEVRELVKQKAGTTVEELFGFGKSAGKSTAKRAKAAAKYRDPHNAANTWTGRGRMPTWLQAKVDGGAKKESFLIK